MDILQRTNKLGIYRGGIFHYFRDCGLLYDSTTKLIALDYAQILQLYCYKKYLTTGEGPQSYVSSLILGHRLIPL